MSALQVTQRRSRNGANPKQLDTLRSLGLRRIGHTVELKDLEKLARDLGECQECLRKGEGEGADQKLREAGATAEGQRKAHFVSALCVAWPDGHVEEFEAQVDGTVVWPPRGDKGFGYDPIFLPDGHARTFGEMPSEEKHGLPPKGKGLSHRARAFLKLAEGCLG